MSRRYVMVLMLLAVILTGFSVALSRRDSHDWRSIRSRRMLPFPWQDTVGLTVFKPGAEPLRFQREPGAEWRVELAEGMWDSLDSRASDNFAALATLTRRDPIQDRTPPDPDQAMALLAVSQPGQEVRLEFGDVQNNIRSVVVDGDQSVVYGVNQDFLSFLDWPKDRLQNTYLASVGGGREPERVSLSPAPHDKSVTVTLVRRPGEWGLTEPVEWPADEARTDVLLRWLDRLGADAVAAQKRDDPEAYGLKTPSARVEAVYNSPGGIVTRRIDFGSENGAGGVYAAVESRSPVFVVSRDLLAEIFPGTVKTLPEQWRSYYRKRSINILGDEDPVAYRVERLLPSPAVLTVAAGENGWFAELQDENGVRRFPVDAPEPGHPGYRYMGTPLGMLKYGLADMRIQSFPVDMPPGQGTERWTAFPAWRLSCRYADGNASPVLTIYAAGEDGGLPCGNPYIDGDADPQSPPARKDGPGYGGFAFSLSNRPAVLESYAPAAAWLCLPPYRYRSKRLLRLDAGSFMKVVVKNRGNAEHAEEGINGDTTVYYRRPDDINNQWWRNPDAPVPLMDDNNRFADMMDKLSRLEAEGYVADADADMSEFGLDRPEITAIVYTSIDGAEDAVLVTLAFGKKAVRDGYRYARLDGEGPVFILPEKIASAVAGIYH